MHRHRDSSYRISIRQATRREKATNTHRGQVIRAVQRDGADIRIVIDGVPSHAQAGESLLVAILAERRWLRRLECGGEARAGFCLMGACQDCWVWIDDDRRVRACTTPAVDGMRVRIERSAEEAAPDD